MRMVKVQLDNIEVRIIIADGIEWFSLSDLRKIARLRISKADVPLSVLANALPNCETARKIGAFGASGKSANAFAPPNAFFLSRNALATYFQLCGLTKYDCEDIPLTLLELLTQYDQQRKEVETHIAETGDAPPFVLDRLIQLEREIERRDVAYERKLSEIVSAVNFLYGLQNRVAAVEKNLNELSKDDISHCERRTSATVKRLASRLYAEAKQLESQGR